MKTTLALLLTGALALAGGGCMERETSKVYSTECPKFDPAVQPVEIEGLIHDTMPHCVGGGTSVYPITFVNVEVGIKQLNLIYPYAFPVQKDKMARISYKPINGAISTEEFMRNFTPFPDTSNKRQIKTDGIIMPDGIKYTP